MQLISLAIPEMSAILAIRSSLMRVKIRRFFLSGNERAPNRTRNAAAGPHFDPKYE